MNYFTFILLIFFSLFSYASDSLEGLPTNETVEVSLVEGITDETRIIQFIKLKYTQKYEDIINQRLKEVNKKNNSTAKFLDYTNNADKLFELGMENVPILDQGQEATCATFATTGYLNALKRSGDLISQQCLLQFSPSSEYGHCVNWKTGNVNCIYGLVNQYGVVNKKDCPNVYPKKQAPTLDYYQYQELSKGNQWANSFLFYDIPNYNYVNKIKSYLNQGHRVLISMQVMTDTYENNVGYPVDGYSSGLWKLPPNSTNVRQICGQNLDKCAGHLVIITGYDENRQYFKVRNSWGKNYGMNGDYYMTYDYLRVMTYGGAIITLA